MRNGTKEDGIELNGSSLSLLHSPACDDGGTYLLGIPIGYLWCFPTTGIPIAIVIVAKSSIIYIRTKLLCECMREQQGDAE